MIAALAERPEELKEQGNPTGENQYTKKEEETLLNKVSSGKKAKYGTNADYLTARIARDRPDVLERMKRGEFSSVAAAAREAGIVRLPSTLEQLQRLCTATRPW